MKMTLIDVVMGWKYMSTSAAKSDARVKLGVPTSSRTSLPARIEIAVRPAVRSQHCSTLLILAAIARISESANLALDETFTMTVVLSSGTSLGGLIGP
jgi:hypothetical protein